MSKSVLVKSNIREQILDAAERLLGRFGYQKTTMDDLAREANVAKRTIYLHFQNKEDVHLSSIDRVVNRLLEKLLEIANSNAQVDVRLREMIVTRIMFRFDSVRDFYQSFDEMLGALRPAYMIRREYYFTAEAEQFAQVLEEGKTAGIFDFVDALETAKTIIFATNSLLPFSLSKRELGLREETLAKVEGIADLLLNGLIKP